MPKKLKKYHNKARLCDKSPARRLPGETFGLVVGRCYFVRRTERTAFDLELVPAGFFGFAFFFLSASFFVVSFFVDFVLTSSLKIC